MLLSSEVSARACWKARFSNNAKFKERFTRSCRIRKGELTSDIQRPSNVTDTEFRGYSVEIELGLVTDAELAAIQGHEKPSITEERDGPHAR